MVSNDEGSLLPIMMEGSGGGASPQNGPDEKVRRSHRRVHLRAPDVSARIVLRIESGYCPGTRCLLAR